MKKTISLAIATTISLFASSMLLADVAITPSIFEITNNTQQDVTVNFYKLKGEPCGSELIKAGETLPFEKPECTERVPPSAYGVQDDFNGYVTLGAASPFKNEWQTSCTSADKKMAISSTYSQCTIVSGIDGKPTLNCPEIYRNTKAQGWTCN